MKPTPLLLTCLIGLAVPLAGLAQPTITVQPQSQTNVVGSTLTLSVEAAGVPPLVYGWRKTGVPVAGATNAALVFTNFQASHAGNYTVVITNIEGAVTSTVAFVRVLLPPAITTQPTNFPVLSLGASVSNRVAASGTAPLYYQWRLNGTNLLAETNTLLVIANLQLSNAGAYTAVVTNSRGSVTSVVVTLRVDPTFTKITDAPSNDAGYSLGAAWGDYDGDGFIDLFVVNTGPVAGSSASHFLYHNNRNGTFSRVTNGPVAAVASEGFGAAWGDYDNDGHLDLVLVNWNQPNYLFHNNGDGSFAAVSNASIVSDIAEHRSVTWVDYDSDGYVDLFSTTGTTQPRRLYHNNHDGTFTRITQGAFLTVPGSFLGVAWGDYNNDGRPDLFLPQANEPSGLPSYLYRNDTNGTFTRVGAGMVDGNSRGIAAAWGDYDNDGDLDLFVSCSWIPDGSAAGRPNLFYRNDGSNTFTRLTSLPANDPENQGGASTGCKWGDYDNDGWLDLFVANRFGNDFLYHNNGNGTFAKITNSIAVNDGGSWASAWGDYDNDGFLDLFVGGYDAASFLYHNNTNDNHWLKFRLIGTRSNRAGIGAKVRVHATINGQSFWQMREVSGGDGTLGQNSLHVHFGLGDATNADLVRIEWPSGTVQELTSVAAQQFLTVTEPGGEPRLAAGRESGQVQLTLTGKQGSRYAIQTSTALNNWTNAGLTVTVTNRNGAVTFPAPGATNDAQRFYRAVWQ